MKDLIESVARAGDPAKGEALFRRKETSCLKCHAIAGAGGQVGPDLSTIGSVAQIDYLIDSILDPNKAVKENYHSMVVVTRDGRSLTGIKVRQGPDDLVLRDGRPEVSIRRDDQEQTMAGSVMPSGLADSLTSAELRDLVRFLSELGKAGPYAVTRGPVARRWRLIESPTTAVPRDDDPAWAAAYSDVVGTLPLADLLRSAAGGAVIARCDVAVTTGGDFKLLLGSTDGLEPGRRQLIAAAGRLRCDAAWRSLLAFRFDPRSERMASAASSRTPGSGGLAQFVGGK
jgi:putative heme-binding domain-containing protein